jgi:hypothetical protein
MKSILENSLKENETPESALLYKQAEEFETKLREENMSLYRRIKLQNFMVKTKNNFSKNLDAE